MNGSSEVRGLASEHEVHADILSQALTGELVGMLNFARIADLFPDVADKMEAVEHANGERAHAAAFQAVAADLKLQVVAQPDAPYWRRVREAFKRWADRKDLTACVVIQELMLESHAVALYEEVGAAIPGRMGSTFARIAADEAEHLQHAVDFLRRQREASPREFDNKLELLHEEVMTVLAEMLAEEDPRGHCGLCRDACVKHSLASTGLRLPTLRGKALNAYLTALDRIGVPGERTMKWIANLPV